jgi:hypothetical protein
VLGSVWAERSAKPGHDDANLRVCHHAMAINIPWRSCLLPLMPCAEAVGTVQAAACSRLLAVRPQNAAIQVLNARGG